VRIAYLVSQYPAVNHTFILAEVRGLRALGLDVETASIKPADRPPSALDPDEAEEAARTFYVRPLGPARIAAAQFRYFLGHPLQYLRGAWMAVGLGKWNLKTSAANMRHLSEAVVVGQWMDGIAIHHLHTHFASTTALLVSRLFPVKLSFTIHGPSEFNDSIGFMIPEKVHAAGLVLAISSYGRSQMMYVSHPEDWDKIKVAYLGVDISALPFNTRLPAPDGVREIISVGRLAPAKGTLVLLNACKQLLDRGHRIRLRLVGDGPDRQRLELATKTLGISEHVVFEGALSHQRVLELYRNADIFALASFAEGIPVVLMEAMALGIPCVSTRITGIPELIEDGVSGLLVPASDHDALADALQRLAEDPGLSSSIGLAARSKVVKDYNSSLNIRRVKSLFEEFFES
jgi:colanic acid/amylovoran biosynthesis glycosyltransferase